MAIDAQHPQYVEEEPTWRKIEDITRLKNLSSYLIKLNPHDDSAENNARNEQYRKRAVFYAIAQQTVSGLLGLMFNRAPAVNLPSGLEYLAENADGAGVSIVQQSKGISEDVVRKSRGGLYVSYPKTDAPVSRADIQSGRMVATIHRLEPESIINWRTRTVGSKTILELVVIAAEDERVGSDGYEVVKVPQMRELFLDEDGTYNERIWEKDNKNEWQPKELYAPRDHSGNPLTEIPFTFVGAENNDHNVDPSNMRALVEVNIGHYRNSADFEDSVWFAGQPQPWMSGITKAHLDLMKEAGMYVGSRNVLGVPAGEQFGFASAPPNPLVKEAMADKVMLMVQLGARMIQPGTAAKTATQVSGEREAQHSTLSLIAANVSEAYRKAIAWAGAYMGIETNDVEFELNRQFVRPDADAAEIREVVATFIQGALPVGDYVRYMKERDLMDPDKPDEEYTEELADAAGSGMGMPDMGAPE